MSDSNTLLVCLDEFWKNAGWLVALSRNDSEWHETHRLQTDSSGEFICALSDSRVLIGRGDIQYMELFRVESGPRIARLHRIHVTEQYCNFSATRTSDTLVAMSYPKDDFRPNADNSVRLHRLRGDRLEELARIQLKQPYELLWLADRLLVTDRDREKKAYAVIELEVSDTRLERRRELIATSEKIDVFILCAVNDELAIFDYNSSDTLLYSFVESTSLPSL